MRAILTKAQQEKFLSDNWRYRDLSHKWSTRGDGVSRFLDAQGNTLGKAGGSGYDRRGTALGNAMMALFPAEILTLAKRTCKGARGSRRKQGEFYGLFYNAKDGTAYLDGGCGESCMIAILNKIGFRLHHVGESEQSRSGQQFYSLRPMSAKA